MEKPQANKTSDESQPSDKHGDPGTTDGEPASKKGEPGGKHSSPGGNRIQTTESIRLAPPKHNSGDVEPHYAGEPQPRAEP
ncbi:MAG: hypothetical protein V7K92_21885 [Nostoc sp.]|uniref:hypothetical protein n=1 Tax=Nostoc sp. TaxID=1180 RepID=UPI002FF2F86C